MPILSVQSHVCFGYVGNRAAAFPLQRLGFDVWAVNTVQFSNHTGYGAWRGEVSAPAQVAGLIEGVLQRAAPGDCEAVLSGYLGSAELGEAIVSAVERLRRAEPVLYCCDPVMGDVGRGVFVGSEIPAFMAARAVPAADILTPNLFELELLTGRTVTTLADAIEAARRLIALGPRLVLVTSLRHADTPADRIELLAVEAARAWRVSTPYVTLEPPRGGLGDATTALFLAHYLKTGAADAALAATAAAVHELVLATAAKPGRELALIEAQDRIVAPRRTFPVDPV
jgi:pyridoxine kinase